MRVLFVGGQLVAPQMTIWREVGRRGVDLQIVGALRHVRAAGEWWRPEAPDWGSMHLVRPIAAPRRGQSWWYYPGLARLSAELHPDLIHVDAEPWAVRVSQVLGSKSPVVVHAADNRYAFGGRLVSATRSRRLRGILPQLAGLVSWNAAGVRLAREFGLPPASPTLVAPAELPDPDEFSVGEATQEAFRGQLGLGAEEIAVGFFGRLEAEKGPVHLVRAFLRADLPGARLFVFGSGSLRRAVEEAAAVAGDRVRVMGPIPLGRVPAAIAAMDVIVVPSFTMPTVAEQFSRVAVEAMMAGTAVIVSDCGALPEVVGDAAVIVPEGSETELSTAITHLATNEAARRELVAKGVERVRAKHNPKTIAGEIVRFWSRVVEGQ